MLANGDDSSKKWVIFIIVPTQIRPNDSLDSTPRNLHMNKGSRIILAEISI